MIILVCEFPLLKKQFCNSRVLSMSLTILAICYVAYGNKCITIFRDPVEMVESIKYENQVMFDTQ